MAARDSPVTLCPVSQRGGSVIWQSAPALTWCLLLLQTPSLRGTWASSESPVGAQSWCRHCRSALKGGLRSSWTQVGAHRCGGLSSPGKGQRKRREAGPGISINLPNRAVGVCKLEAPVRISQRGAPSCSSWLKTSVMTAPAQESLRCPPSGSPAAQEGQLLRGGSVCAGKLWEPESGSASCQSHSLLWELLPSPPSPGLLL